MKRKYTEPKHLPLPKERMLSDLKDQCKGMCEWYAEQLDQYEEDPSDPAVSELHEQLQKELLKFHIGIATGPNGALAMMETEAKQREQAAKES